MGQSLASDSADSNLPPGLSEVAEPDPTIVDKASKSVNLQNDQSIRKQKYSENQFILPQLSANQDQATKNLNIILNKVKKSYSVSKIGSKDLMEFASNLADKEKLKAKYLSKEWTKKLNVILNNSSLTTFSLTTEINPFQD